MDARTLVCWIGSWVGKALDGLVDQPRPKFAHAVLDAEAVQHTPVSAQALAESQAPSAWKTVRWREGTRGTMQSRFARLRVRAAHRDARSRPPREPEWLLIEWPRGEARPTKYFLSSVPGTASMEDLVRLVKIRWRIERDYQELKDELGLDHYCGPAGESV
jgi:SRSO17 transposase